MKRLVVRLVLSVLMSVLCFSVAQAAVTYPLQLSAHILPPYGCRLSDYVVQGMERLNLTVLQRDLRYSNYDFLVRMQVKQGTKIVISSTAGYTVKSGQLTRLNSANLFNGLTADITAQDKYKENGFCLNEGAYEFVFQAFDAKNTALPVSEPVYFHTYLSKALPPACVFPANGSCVDYKSAAVSFAWMEKSVSMPSNGKRYSLEVYEMPEGFDGTDRAENLAGASEPVYRKDDINGNVTVHTAPISAGMFIKGRTYVWRVRSYSADFGQADSRVSGHVENNGYSQYSAFKFGTCVDVEDVWKKKDQAAIGAVKYDSSKKPVLESVDTSGAVAVVEWLHEPEKFCGYVVEWNMADTALAPWGQKIVSEKDSFAYISGLSYGVDYIVRLRGVICNGSEEQAYSACADNVLSFRLEKREDAECGNPVPQVTSLVSLKEAMKEGDVLSANGHDVTVLTCEMNVSGSDTTFTGTGLVSYGFLKSFFNLTVKFDNVKINDRKELLQGMVYANTDLNNCLDLNLNRLANKGSAGSGPAQRQTAKFDEFSSADNIPENKAGLAGGTMYAWDADGNRVECGTLEDTSCASNNLFVDSRHGEVLFDNLEGMEWNPPFDREKRPFDRNLTFSDYYENLDGYSVPWIGVPEGGATKVKATLLQGASVNPNDVHFVLRTGSQSIRLNAKRIDGNSSVATYEVPVFADKAGDKGAYLELSAVVSTGEGACSQQLVLGVAKVYALKREHFNVRLVPCHNVSIDEDAIAKKLNEIYKPLGKTFTVTEDELFYGDTAFAFIADTFDVKNISRRSTETEDMTFLKYIYREERGFSKDSVYLFVLPKANIDGVTGFMPRGKHVGYLFCGENETIDERTVAHELGHGLFTLEHAFDYIDGSPVGSTNNLMDYSDGTNLKVWQWNHMDTHGPVLPFFDDAEDAMMGDFSALKEFVKNKVKCLSERLKQRKYIELWVHREYLILDAMICLFDGNGLHIPESFWNAKHENYYFKGVENWVNPLFVKLACGENETAKDLVGLSGKSVALKVAFICGMINSALDLVDDLVETVKLIEKVGAETEAKLKEVDREKVISLVKKIPGTLAKIKNVDYSPLLEDLTVENVKNKAKDGASKLWNEFWTFHGVKDDAFNEFQASYAAGYDLVYVGSFFIGAGEVAAIAKGASAGKVLMASVKATANSLKIAPAKRGLKGIKEIEEIKGKTVEFLKATNKFNDKIKKACNETVAKIKESKSKLEGKVNGDGSVTVGNAKFTKDKVKLESDISVNDADVLYISEPVDIELPNGTRKNAPLTVTEKGVSVLGLDDCAKACKEKLKGSAESVVAGFEDKFKKHFANASASDLKKLMNNPDLIDIYNALIKSKPKIGNVDVQLLENCMALQKKGFSLDEVFKFKNLLMANGNRAPFKYTVQVFSDVVNSKLNIKKGLEKVAKNLGNIGGHVAEGAEWMLRHVKNKMDDFANKDLYFEIDVKNPKGRRTADLKVCENGKEIGCTYFEFKSVKEVPPGNFNEQFVKDLLNDDVNDLSQIKWIFDRRKISKKDLEALKNRIKTMDIPPAASAKFNLNTIDELKKEIVRNFDNIFQVQ